MTPWIAAANAETLSADVTFSGLVKIKADDLGENEYVVVLEERVDGGYDTLLDGGAPVVLTKNRPSVLLELLGKHKVRKSYTEAQVAVGYVTQ